jgi:iron complex outermembrane receptor protein
MKYPSPVVFATVLALFVFFTTTPDMVYAQQVAQLEEVIVTARKREQSLQDVSVAVTALSATMLTDGQIFTCNPRQSSFNIRGVGTQSFSTGVEPSVSTMLDGVVMGRSGAAFMQLLDVQRVEVLRGPQGTLFGKNSSAGVVHIITEDPADEFEGEAMLGLADGDEYRGGVSVSGPISDQLGYRLTANGTDMDGWVKNYYNGDDLNNRDEWSVRGKLRWNPTDTLEFKWASDYSDMNCDCTANTIRSMEPFGGNDAQIQGILDDLAPVQPGDENNDTNVNGDVYNKWDSWGHSLEVNWDIGEFTLTSITAYREYSVDASTDDDYQPTTVLGFEQAGSTDQDQTTQELRLTSPAGERLNYVLGLFYFDQTVDRQFVRGFELVADLPGVGVSTFSVDTENWAAFGEATYSFSDRWRLIAGVRYTDDQLDFEFERVVEGLPSALPQPVEKTPGGTSEDDTSGKLALEWDYNDDGMLYLSYAQGYKGPAYDVTFGTDPTTLEPVDPETAEAWELGLKSNWFDNRLRFNVAVFSTEYDDFQGQAFIDPDGPSGCPPEDPNCNPDNETGSFALVNAGKVESEGVEIDFMAQVTQDLRIFGGVAFIDATIDEYPGGPCSFGQVFRDENGCAADSTQDLSGGDMPFSPDWKLSLTAQYTWELPTSYDLILQSSLRAQDDILFGLSQDEYTEYSSYEIVDVSAKLADRENRWEATLYVKNVFDEFYITGIGSLPGAFLPNGYVQVVPKLSERTVGGEVRYRW